MPTGIPVKCISVIMSASSSAMYLPWLSLRDESVAHVPPYLRQALFQADPGRTSVGDHAAMSGSESKATMIKI